MVGGTIVPLIASSSFLSAFHFLYLSAVNANGDQSQIVANQSTTSLNVPNPAARISSGVGLRPYVLWNWFSHDLSSILRATDSADIASGAKPRAKDLDHRYVSRSQKVSVNCELEVYCDNNCDIAQRQNIGSSCHKYATEQVRDVNATLFSESESEYLPIHMRSYPTNIYSSRKESKLRRTVVSY